MYITTLEENANIAGTLSARSPKSQMSFGRDQAAPYATATIARKNPSLVSTGIGTSAAPGCDDSVSGTATAVSTVGNRQSTNAVTGRSNASPGAANAISVASVIRTSRTLAGAIVDRLPPYASIGSTGNVVASTMTVQTAAATQNRLGTPAALRANFAIVIGEVW